MLLFTFCINGIQCIYYSTTCFYSQYYTYEIHPYCNIWLGFTYFSVMYL